MHRIDIALAAERAAVGQFAHETAVRHRQMLALAADRGILEIDVETDLKARRRIEPRLRLAHPHLDRGKQAQRADRRAQPLDPRGHEGTREWRGAAIKDRNLGAIHFDKRVVDAASGECRHQMLDRVHMHAGLVPNPGAQLRGFGKSPGRGNVGDVRRDIDAPEHDPMIGGRRQDCQADEMPRMQACPAEPHRCLKGCLHFRPRPLAAYCTGAAPLRRMPGIFWRRIAPSGTGTFPLMIC
jgi:hypothetical protein